MEALILAAGYAVRLGSLTSDMPKSLLEIGKHKIIDRMLEKVAASKEVDSIYIITNNKFLNKFNDWLKSSKYNKRISLINDGSDSNETRLGAIKDLELAIEEKRIDEDLLVVAGDNLFEFDLAEFLKFALEKRDGISVALHDINDYNEAKRFGVVKIDESKRITDFEEKPKVPKSTLISTGIYYFPKEKLSFINKYLNTSDKIDAPGYFISWVAGTDRVYGFVFLESWYDIGDTEAYNKADREYLKKESERYGKT